MSLPPHEGHQPPESFLHVAREFARTPGGRHVAEGEFSGEAFRDELLVPRLRSAMERGDYLVVDLDGTAGFSTGFLEEAFGGLVRLRGFPLSAVLQHLRIRSTEEPYLVDDVLAYLHEAAASQP